MTQRPREEQVPIRTVHSERPSKNVLNNSIKNEDDLKIIRSIHLGFQVYLKCVGHFSSSYN